MSEQKTFEDILREKMGQAVKVKNSDAQIMPMEAMVNAVMADAMKGNLPAIMFIRSLTEGKAAEVDVEKVKQLITDVADELKGELKEQGLPISGSAELWLLAKQLLTIRRLAVTTAQEGHADVLSTPQKNGPDRMELSTDNRIFNDLLKQWRTDWRDFKASLLQSEISKRMLKK